MRLKQKPGDFRVREVLEEGYLAPRGSFRVYLVTKRKRTSLDAAAALADLAGVDAADVGIAGLKDRQGVTAQYMSVPGGRPVRLRTPDLSVEPAGFAAERLESRHSAGNAFTLVVRGLPASALAHVRAEIGAVGVHGLPNYFGEQRFGNLRFGQGWIARDLALGYPERALERLLCSSSESDDPRSARFKTALASRWGDWRACREIAGTFGAHHSVFEHLARHPGDFAGAFRYVASRVRLIHLYAWQSHLWNRAVARHVEEVTSARERIAIRSPEGRLVYARGAVAVDPSMGNRFRLPGPGLADVEHPRQKALLAEVLASEGIPPERYRIEGVPGFQIKGEDRALVVHPRDIELSTRAAGRSSPGRANAILSFTLPRGAYALLVVHRVLAGLSRGRPERQGGPGARRPPPGARRPRPGPPRPPGRKGNG